MKIKRKRATIIIFFSLLIIFSASVYKISADDDEEEDDNGIGFIDSDTAEDIGYISIGLFAAGMLNVIVLYIFKFTRKFLDDEGKSGKVKNFTKEFYMKTREPLNWLHYLSTLAATTIIILHGLRFLNKEEEMGIIGWVTTGLFLLYIITGIIIKIRIKPIWSRKVARKTLNILHKNLIIFMGIVVLHLAHFLIAD